MFPGFARAAGISCRWQHTAMACQPGCGCDTEVKVAGGISKFCSFLNEESGAVKCHRSGCAFLKLLDFLAMELLHGKFQSKCSMTIQQSLQTSRTKLLMMHF